MMAKSPQTDAARAPVPDLLAHLECAFGWSEPQALDALGEYMMSTEAGHALRHELCARESVLGAGRLRGLGARRGAARVLRGEVGRQRVVPTTDGGC